MTDIGSSKRFNSWHNKRFPLSRYWVPRDSIEIDSTHLAFGHTILVVFGGSVVTKDWVHGVGHSLVCKILFQIVVRAMITFSPPAWTSSAGMLSTPADFPFFNDFILQPPLFCEGWVVIICVCLGTVQYWWISNGFVIVQLIAVFCPSVSFLCEAFFFLFLNDLGQ